MSDHVVELVVRGPLSPELIHALEGFRVEHGKRGLTRIVGAVADQARLFGIMEFFDDLHIEVVSMQPVDFEGFSPRAGGDGGVAAP
jgi:hypothetical protein